ncbi:MAG: tetratricopeptide repeat protein, partial [Candidatus Hodarchaeota archaeon]
KVLNPRDERPYLFSAEAFMKLKRFDDALKELRSLITLDPKNTDYRVRLIKTLLAARRVDEAIDEYCKMMRNEPHLPKTTCDTIRHHRRKGNHKKVARILYEALSSVLQR